VIPGKKRCNYEMITINESPRKGWNTAVLFKRAFECVASKGTDTELVQFYDLNFKRCTSCFQNAFI
jgi:multimeric flavodoxin WrbA